MFGQKNKEKEAQDTGAASLNKLGKGTFFEGKLRSEGDLRIDGEFKGNIDINARIVLGTTGVVSGDIKCKNAEISGKLVGNIEVSEMLILKSTTFIQGDIQTNKLIIEDGARFNGSCKMGSNLNISHNNTLGQNKIKQDVAEQR